MNRKHVSDVEFRNMTLSSCSFLIPCLSSAETPELKPACAAPSLLLMTSINTKLIDQSISTDYMPCNFYLNYTDLCFLDMIWPIVPCSWITLTSVVFRNRYVVQQMFQATKRIQQNGAFNGVLHAYLGWLYFKQPRIAKYMLPSLTSKHSHYNSKTIASG